MACPHCGSWSVKADRGLAGRLVCGRCARPLGRGQTSRQRRRPLGARGLSMGIGLAALVSLSALLAALDQQGSRPSDPFNRRPAKTWPAP